MKTHTAGRARWLRGTLGRALIAIAAAVSLLGSPAAASPAAATPPIAAAASAGWYDGSIRYSAITNCVSIIQGAPYLEYGAGTYVGYYADPTTSKPAVNETYYLHIVIYGLGNSCSGQYAWPNLVLPANTNLAITGTDKVYCFAGGSPDTANCPQSLPFNAVNAGYSITPTGGGFWPLPQGGNWEWRVPVRSSTTLTSSIFGARVVMADGNSNPTIVPSQNVFVFNPAAAPVPAIVYPTPNTDSITRTSATSYANIYTGGLAGIVHFQLGTSTAYGPYNSSFALGAGPVNWALYDDWTPTVLTPDTLYHFRMWFDPTDPAVANAIGVDQTFRTLGAATSFQVGGLAGGLAGGTKQAVTVTAKDASNTTATTYRGTIQFSSDDVNAGLPADYTFTALDNGSKTFANGVALMTAGTHEVRVRDKANSAITGAQAGITVTSTVTPPTATLGSVTSVRTTLSVPLTWSGTGAVNYDVQYRKAPYNAGFGAPILLRSKTTAKTYTHALAAGYTYCYSARSRNASGAVSAWTAERCTATPLDDRSMTRTGTWTLGTGTAYYKGTYSSSTTSGRKLTRTGAQFKRLSIVATTCSTCGTVRVYLGSTLLKTISLKSTSTVNRKILSVGSWADLKTGTLSLQVYGSGKKVLIDGVILGH